MPPVSDTFARFEHARALVDAGQPVARACTAAGLPRPSYYRLLEEKDSEPSAARIGRPPCIVLTPNEIKALKGYFLTKDSLPKAVDLFLADPVCRPETAERLRGIKERSGGTRRREQYPMSLYRQVQPTVEEREAFRGPKHLAKYEFYARRALTVRLPDGTERPCLPGEYYESDDMDFNEPYSYDDEHGVRLVGRQSLMSMDVPSHAWLGGIPLARPYRAYRVEDIMDHLLDIVQAWGLPLYWRFEKGSWASLAIDGLPLDDKRAHSYGLGGGRFAGKRWGGLNDLFTVLHAKDSDGKGTIEGGFDMLQTLLAHRSLHIGRKRGEFERATKLARQAADGQEHALERFWDIVLCAEGMAVAMDEDNRSQKARRSHGRDMVVPSELWATRGPKRELQPKDSWYFYPVKRFATVLNCRLDFTLDGWPRPFSFLANGDHSGTYLSHGTRVLVAFHPGQPGLGCHVFNAEVGSRNRHSLPIGELICVAPNLQDVPIIDLSERKPGTRSAGKQATASLRAEARIPQAPGTGPAPRRSVARNSQGQTTAAVAVGLPGHQPQSTPVTPVHTAAPAPVADDRLARLARLAQAEEAAREALGI